MVDWKTLYENDRLKKKKKKPVIRMDYETRIADLIASLEKIKYQAKLLRCEHDYAIARESLKDLRMMMRNAKKI